ncbi:hypothetical protein E2C01_082626 [Portunus trituberculatus]|uniref:Uncharacterized protein n=1 Tax=Portunus trituberculatus TaxID=210409 RepID=A0A5B7IZS7_PORTR|nr:hypothetical protein [Portunus trituberculatus]
MNKRNIKGYHSRQKKRETRKNLCVAWTSKLLQNVSVVSKKALETLKESNQILPGVAKWLMT